MTNAARLLAAPLPPSVKPLRSASDHTPTGAEFAALRARRRRRMEARASAGQLAAVGTLGANIIESEPRAHGTRPR